MTVDLVRIKILAAFRNVVLGDGIGLWQAQAIDDYETKEFQLKARARDEKTNWLEIPEDDLSKCHSSLSFLDAEGMRFLVPAFILAELSGNIDEGPMYSLSQSVVVYPNRFRFFNAVQKQAIASYLEYCLVDADYAFDAPHIKRALDEFWRRN